jgi:predicted nucleic acid-binding protein
VDPVLLDTNVYSYLTRGADDPQGAPYRRHVTGRTVVICQITAGELLFGAVRRGWSERRVQDLQEKARGAVMLPLDFPVCVIYAQVKANLRTQGRIIGDNDIWIAAFALRRSIPLVSNNRRHFENIPGLVLITEAS